MRATSYGFKSLHPHQTPECNSIREFFYTIVKPRPDSRGFCVQVFSLRSARHKSASLLNQPRSRQSSDRCGAAPARERQRSCRIKSHTPAYPAGFVQKDRENPQATPLRIRRFGVQNKMTEIVQIKKERKYPYGRTAFPGSSAGQRSALPYIKGKGHM